MESSPSDNILVERVKNGDQQAFATLIERYEQKVFQTSMGFVHNTADAEDLAQEVFIKAYKAIDSFKGESSFGTWIYRITVNKSINQLRKNKLRAMSGLYDHETESHEEAGADFYLLQEEQRRQIKNALRQLNSTQKKIFILFYYQDLSIKEISVILKITPKSAESTLFRARKKLQNELQRI